MDGQAKKRVAVIGGGLSGLVSLKECLAEGLEAVAIESRSEIGGQWAYQPDPETLEGDTLSSIYDGVVLNSCRDTTSFSDFPLDPALYGEYFGHRQMLRYIHKYVDHFNLRSHVRLRTKVLSCVQNEDGTWNVKLQQEGKQSEEETYDALLAATGARTHPLIPEFRGRELFKGEFLHSQYYRKPGRFEGKKVAIVGLGSAAVDLACELAPGCSEVYMITRRGGWILPRYVLGKPIEAWDSRATQVWLPSSVSQYLQTKLLNTVQGKHPKVLQADHSILAQNPTIRGDFIERVRNGSIQAHRTSIESFTETGLKLENGMTLDVDIVIACTGYDFSAPYLPHDVVRSQDTPPNTVDLWKLMVPLRYRNLFMIGFTELAGPAPPASEAQARLAASIIAGRVQIPEGQHLERDVREWQAWQAQAFVRSERHSITDHYVPYIDSVLAPLGANPTLGRLLWQILSGGSPWKALQTLNAVYFGITSSAQWRLCGYGSNPEQARETIVRIASGKEEMSSAEKKYLDS
ncbi:flavin-containing monooxygenase [Xylaria cf. heliscus]|nr:flavin-containing monooxygenase [Xylaria cf. heliscus]